VNNRDGIIKEHPTTTHVSKQGCSHCPFVPS